MESARPEFWEQRYRAGRLPWDAGGVPPALAAFLERLGPGARQVLVPGCGSGYEVKAFLTAGGRVCAIDFAPAAVERARTVLGAAGTCVRQADFFTGDIGADYDLIYERTFLCSLPPSCWADYARRVAALLRPGGVLAGIFFHGHEPEPPPYPLSAGTAAGLFDAAFELVEDEAIPAANSLPLYAGGERWQVWRRRPHKSSEGHPRAGPPRRH